MVDLGRAGAAVATFPVLRRLETGAEVVAARVKRSAGFISMPEVREVARSYKVISALGLRPTGLVHRANIRLLHRRVVTHP